MPARKRPQQLEPTPPSPDVAEKQDPSHTVGDFLGGLRRVTRRSASEPDRGSSKTLGDDPGDGYTARRTR